MKYHNCMDCKHMLILQPFLLSEYIIHYFPILDPRDLEMFAPCSNIQHATFSGSVAYRISIRKCGVPEEVKILNYNIRRSI